jgi:tRNA 2-selenouridine synthase
MELPESLQIPLLSACMDLRSCPLVDVRSPAEFQAGHVPGAISMPLFTDQERALVGSCYKTTGQTAAFDLGLRFVGPRLDQMVRRCRALALSGRVNIMCWRGGQRSSSVAWLLRAGGLEASAFPGGYKAFRAAMRSVFERPWHLQLIGGHTGSGKTELLYEIRDRGEQILDLEAAAHHRGSAFGQVNQPSPPTQEHFENRLGWALANLDPGVPVWVEDESRMLGRCKIPDAFYEQMQRSPLWTIERSKQERIDRLMGIYAPAGPSELGSCTWKLHKKLGRELTHQIIQCIQQGELAQAIAALLPYYDKGYLFCMKRRLGPVIPLATEALPFPCLAQTLLSAARQLCHH